MTMHRHRMLGWAAYCISVLLILFPLVDSLLTVWPFQLTTGTWRYGAVGLFSRALMTPLLGLLLGAFTAVVFEHRAVLRVFSLMAFMGTLTVLAATGLFIFDAGAARAQVVPQAMTSFNIAGAMAILKFGLTGAVALVLGMGAWVASARPKGPRSKKPGSDQEDAEDSPKRKDGILMK